MAQGDEFHPAPGTRRCGGLARRDGNERKMRASSHGANGTARFHGGGDPGDPVLTSKVTMPAVPGWAVIRPRIDKLLADGARGPLTSVTGPPGAGKTMA